MSGLQRDAPKLVLASSSPTRAALLRAAGLMFAVVPAAIDEDSVKEAARADEASAVDTALLLADLKAERASRRNPEALIIGADQLLVCAEKWFDKPSSLAEASAHLTALRGQTHELVTAIVCHRGGRRIFHHVSRPKLTMRPFSDAFLDLYLAAEGEALLGSVGAYRLEGLGAHLFDRVEGEQAAILGLPMLALLGFLRQHGVLVG